MHLVKYEYAPISQVLNVYPHSKVKSINYYGEVASLTTYVHHTKSITTFATCNMHHIYHTQRGKVNPTLPTSKGYGPSKVQEWKDSNITILKGCGPSKVQEKGTLI